MLAAEEGSREAELPGERSRERSGPACLWRFPAGAGGRRCCPAAAAAGRSRRKGGHAGAAGRRSRGAGRGGQGRRPASVRKARAGARDEERAGGRRQGGKETAGGCSDPVGCGRRDRGAGRETPRVSRKASWELRFETQCWGGFYRGCVPKKQDNKQGVWRDYLAFFAYNLSKAVPNRA